MIIYTRRGFYSMTPHAVDAMFDEDITEVEIRNAIENSRQVESRSSGRDVYIYNGIAVIIDEDDAIVTVYRV